MNIEKITHTKKNYQLSTAKKNMRNNQELIIEKLKKLNIFAVLAIIISLFSILPLFHNGFMSTDDGTWMIIRFSAFHQALMHGQIPVRFLPRLNFEYGYPVADFLYPGFMYIAEPIHLLKINFVDTIKIIFGISLISSAWFTYLWLLKYVTKLSALVGSTVYLYSTYHLTDIYSRGSVGELLAIATVPYILWMIDKKKYIFYSRRNLLSSTCA